MASGRRSLWWDLGALAFLLAVILAFHWPLITPDPARRQSYPEGDFYNQFYAFASYEHDRLWAGEIPLWNPYTFGGHPFLADVQAAVFYPPSLLVMLLSGPGPFSPQWLIVEAIAHFYLGALFMYLFVRRMTAWLDPLVSVTGATVAAVVFGLGGYLTGYPALQLAILETQVWLPLILLLLHVGVAERRWACLLGAGVTWGVALLAGHPQSAMYVFYVALLYGLIRSWQARLSWRWTLVSQVAWVAVGFGLAAVQLVPSWEFMRLSVRASLSYEELAGGFGLRDLAQMLLPGAFTHWSPVYVGIYALLLAGVACLGAYSPGWRKDAQRPLGALCAQARFWTVLTVGSLVLSLGGKALLYRVFYWVVPGFALFRSQERAIYVTSFGLAVLAGCGTAWLCSTDAPGSWRRWARRGALAFGALATGAVILALALGWLRRDGEGGRGLGLGICLVAFGWAGWALARWSPGRRWWWSALSVVVVVVDLFVVNQNTNLSPGRSGDRVYDGAWLAFLLEDARRFRIVNDFGLPGNAGCWLREEDVAGASPLRLQVHKVMIDAVPRWRMWQLLDVGYVSTWEHDLPGPFPATRAAMRGVEWEKNTTYVHRLEADFPRAWVVHRARQAAGLEAIEILQSADFDPLGEVLLADPWVTVSPVPADSQNLISVAYAPEEITIQVDLQAAGWLVLGEWYYPGWQVWVDGTRDVVLRANYGLRGVALERGPHEVVFRFRPTSVYVGGAISASTAVILCALIIARLRRHRKPGEPC